MVLLPVIVLLIEITAGILVMTPSQMIILPHFWIWLTLHLLIGLLGNLALLLASEFVSKVILLNCCWHSDSGTVGIRHHFAFNISYLSSSLTLAWVMVSKMLLKWLGRLCIFIQRLRMWIGVLVCQSTLTWLSSGSSWGDVFRWAFSCRPYYMFTTVLLLFLLVLTQC